MIKYNLRQDLVTYPDEGTYQTYGMDITDTDTNEIIDSIPDISFNRLDAENLIKDCNEAEVDVAHIYDVIEDFLA